MAGVAIGLLGWLFLVVRSPGRSELVARLKGFVWYRHTFCQHFLITGATGSGKTLSGILPLLFQVFKCQPRFGGLCVDYKGVLHERVRAMAAHFGREADVLILAVRPVGAATGWQPPHRFNLVGDRSIPFGTYARCVVDTAVAMGNRHEKRFFRRAAQIQVHEHLGQGDYHSEGQRVAGQWFGKGALRLGLDLVAAPVGEAEFLRLCENQHPLTGEQLTARRCQKDRRVFYDSCPTTPERRWRMPPGRPRTSN